MKQISFTKAREITKLTRSPLSPTTVVHKGGPGIIEAEGQPAPRTVMLLFRPNGGLVRTKS